MQVPIPSKALARLKAAQLEVLVAQDRLGKMIAVAAAAMEMDPDDPHLQYDLDAGVFRTTEVEDATEQSVD